MSQTPDTTVVTNNGIIAALRAGPNGPLIKVTTFKCGSEIIPASENLTDVVGEVYSSNQLQYQVIDTNNVLFKIVLDDSIGDFTIGNIGLFLEDGTLFSITAYNSPLVKTRSVFPSVIGNKRIFNIVIQLTGITAVTDFTFLSQDEAALPIVQTEWQLPLPDQALFPVYMVNSHSQYNKPTLAMRYNNEWFYLPARVADSVGTYVSSVNIHSSVQLGSTVYWSSSERLFKRGNSTDGVCGLRGVDDRIIGNGDIYVDSNLALIPGAVYYAGPNGSLVTNPTRYIVGFALNANALFVSISNTLAEYAPIASPIFTGTPLVPTPTAGDSSTRIATTAFVKRAVEYLIVTDNYEMETSQNLLVDTTNNAFFITLPQAPVPGNTVEILDGGGNLSLNNVTLDPGSYKIDGASGTVPLSVNNSMVKFVYMNATVGWAFFEF